MDFVKRTMHSRVTERMMQDMAIEHFKFIGPEVYRMRTPNGDEYYRVDGLVYDRKTGESKLKRLNLGSYAPRRFDAAGDLKVDYEEVDANLEACKGYLRAMDQINIENSGGYISESYRRETGRLNHYILRTIEIRDEEGLLR